MRTRGRLARVRLDFGVAVFGRPLRKEATRPPPLFIVGSGRCGSTLLRAILTVNPQLHIPPENHVLCGMIREFRLFRRLPWTFVVRNALSRMEYQPHFRMFDICLRELALELNELPPPRRTLAEIIDAVYRYHAKLHKPSATSWGDKTPGNAERLPLIHDVFPDMKVVHMIRDGREVVRSFVERVGRDWELAAEQWVNSILAARSFGRSHSEQYLEIRYEGLVRSPESEIRRCCEFLGLPFDQRMLNHHVHATPDREIRNYAYHREVMNPIFVRSGDDWRTRFDSQAVVAIEARLGPLLRELGYT